MKRVKFVLAIAILPITLFFQASQLGSRTLEQTWEQEKDRGFSRDIHADLLKGKHVFFVAGIMNELAALISYYYPDNIEAARQLGATTSYLGPSSSESIPENANKLYYEILKTHQKIKKPLILVGHSKGGAEALYMLLEHPELILENKVERVVLIQPVIGGSPLADEEPSWSLRCISAILNPNINTLSQSAAKENFDNAFRTFEASLTKIARKLGKDREALKTSISNRIFYVRSQESPEQLSLGVRIVLGACNGSLEYHGPNDGLLLVEAQRDPRIGIDLGILHSDHISLTVSVASNTTQNERQAFMRATFAHIY